MNRLIPLSPRALALITAATALAVAGCTESATAPDEAATSLEIVLDGAPALEPSAGNYEAWVVGADGTIRSAGRFEAAGDGRITTPSPVARPEHVMITVEPPGDSDDRPSEQKLIGGRVDGTTAELTIDRYLTAGVPLVQEPGTHALFTPSDNPELGYPSNEDGGIWLFNVRGDTVAGDFYLRFSNLSRGWTYEGWVVRDVGTPDACWLSYGKFTPDSRGKLKGRDDLGLGPYSGRIDYRRAMPEEIDMPGGDFVGNPHGLPAPCGLEPPLDLNGDRNAGVESRWTHVITIEPRTEDDEPDVGREPFFLRPYRNEIGQGFADEPRAIEYHPGTFPRGKARIVERGTGG